MAVALSATAMSCAFTPRAFADAAAAAAAGVDLKVAWCESTGAQYIDGQDAANCAQNAQTDTCALLPKRLAAAFVIPQAGGDTYEPMEGLQRGTIYPALDIPYTGRFRHGQK